MEKTNFENIIRNQLEGLEFTPSDRVWEGIAKHIQTPATPKRRLVPYMVAASVVALIVASTISLFYFTHKSNTQTNNTTVLNQTTTNQPAPTNAIKEVNTSTEKVTIAQNNKSNTNHTNLPNPAVVNAFDEKAKNNINEKNSIVNNIAQAKTSNIKLPTNAITESTQAINIEDANAEDEAFSIALDNLQKAKTAALQFPLSPHQYTLFYTNKQFDGIKGQGMNAAKFDYLSSIYAEYEEDDTLLSDKQKENYSDAKLAFGFKLSLGISALQQGHFKNNTNDDIVQTTLSNPSTGAQSSIKRLLYYSGPSFITSFVAEKRFTNRSSVSSGLQLSFFTDKIGTSWTNVLETTHFYYVGIPINYQLRLNSFKFNPIYLSVGVEPSLLTSTSGLVYENNANGGILFKRPSSFNKFNLSANMGVYFQPTSNNRKNVWRFGVELKNSLTPLQSSSKYLRNYFMYGGVSAQYMFKYKKK